MNLIKNIRNNHIYSSNLKTTIANIGKKIKFVNNIYHSFIYGTL